MTKLGQNISNIFSGDDWTGRFTITGSVSGSGEDVTGASIIWVLFDSPTGSSLIRKTTASTGHISISASIVDVNVSASDTSGLTGDYYHELQIIRASDGKTQTAAVGWATINRDLVS